MNTIRPISLLFIIGLWVAIAVPKYAFTQTHMALKAELDSIFFLDQNFRIIASLPDFPSKYDSLAQVYYIPRNEFPGAFFRLIHKADSTNLLRVEEIIRQYGYPGKTMVGEPTNNAVFFVIQHSAKIDQYLPLIKETAEKKELDFTLYAKMLDRSLMYQGKEQIYGTQGKGFETIDTKTGEKKWTTLIWPIQNPGSVNRRRKAAGFKTGLKEHAGILGLPYKLYTLKQVKKMMGK